MIKVNAPFFESLMLFLQENVLNLSKIEIQNFYLKWIEEFDVDNGQLLTDPCQIDDEKSRVQLRGLLGAP